MSTETISLAEIPVEDMVKHLQSQKYIVRTDDQDNEYWIKKESDSAGTNLKKWSENLESKIAEVTKVKRNADEKSLDFLARAVGLLNDNSTKVTEELDSLRKSTAEGDSASAEIQKQFDAFKKAKEKEITDLSGKVGNMEGAQFKNRVDLAVNEAMSKIRGTLKQDKDNDKIIEAAVNNEISEFYKNVKAVDHQGGLIYHDSEDKPLIDKTNGNHLGAFEILNDRLGYLIDETRVQGGTGSNGKFTPPGEGDNKFKLQLPDNVKTKVQLTAYLQQEKSLDPNSGEFNNYFKENGTTLPLR